MPVSRTVELRAYPRTPLRLQTRPLGLDLVSVSAACAVAPTAAYLRYAAVLAPSIQARNPRFRVPTGFWDRL